MAMPEILRDRAKEDMIFQRLDERIWSLRNDKPPDMGEVAPKTAFLKKEHPAIYQDALRTSESRKLKVSIQPV